MLDQRVVLPDFLPLVKLRRGVFNYITKRRRNELSPSDQSYHVCEKSGSCVTQAFSKSSRWKSLTLPTWNDEVYRPSNSICFFWISCMSKGKKVKLAFHAMVENSCGNLAVSSIIFYAATCLAISQCLHRNTSEPPSLTIVGFQNLYQYHQKTLVM